MRFWLLLFVSLQVFSQSKRGYWIFFTHKSPHTATQALLSADALNNRKTLGLDTAQYTDLPVSEEYIRKVISTNATLRHKSKWLNALSVNATAAEIEAIKQFPFVKGIQTLETLQLTSVNKKRKKKKHADSSFVPEPSEALVLLNYKAFEKAQFTGKGIKIGVTDAGYLNLDRQDYFEKIMAENRVLATRDFLMPRRENSIFENLTGKDTHGREVSKCIAGKSNKEQFGLAFDAQFYLARTENAKEEKRIEEDAWVAAIEWFDSLGVRLVNSSLGYGKGFDNPAESYTNTQMNGYVTVVARAAQIATSQKEMIIVNSAGNSGSDKEWNGYISSPADARGVLSVGATDAFGGKMNYSSIGPEYNGYLKPDIAAFSKNGTSFSAPLITGLMACMLQAKPDFCNDQLFNILHQSGSVYPFKNNYIGYGVPDCEKIVKQFTGEAYSDSVYSEAATDTLFSINTFEKLEKLKTSKAKVVVYHIKNPGFVVLMEELESNLPEYRIIKHPKADYSLILADGKKYKINWPIVVLEQKEEE